MYFQLFYPDASFICERIFSWDFFYRKIFWKRFNLFWTDGSIYGVIYGSYGADGSIWYALDFRFFPGILDPPEWASSSRSTMHFLRR